MAIEDLRQNPMMGHMLDALDDGEDIGHYGRLIFVMIGRHFVGDDELVELLTKDRDADEGEIRALVQQVAEKGYSEHRIAEHAAQSVYVCHGRRRHRTRRGDGQPQGSRTAYQGNLEPHAL